MKFADLHCHNHMRSYFWLKPQQESFSKKGLYSPWTIVYSNERKQAKGKRATTYNQSDLIKSWTGNLHITFNALYPIEKGFFKAGRPPQFSGLNFLDYIIWLATHEKLPLRSLLQTVYMRIPQRMVKFFQSEEYDYWEMLNDEMEFVQIANGSLKPKHLHVQGGIGRRIRERRAEGQRDNVITLPQAMYQIPKNNAELHTLLNSDKIVMIMTIEGAHALGTDTATYSEYAQRVQQIKRNWHYPVFFITFAHHFYNKLCGHAHSVPDGAKRILNQLQGRNSGFTEEGKKIVRQFLSIDETNTKKSALGYRILIDVKHMSAKSRQWYYYEVVKPCLMGGDTIPVIASHCGYAGIKTLDILIKDAEDEHDDSHVGNFYAWNINMCDEDILLIFKTRGLFGLSFDQRIVGIRKKKDPRNNITALWHNIKTVLEVIYSSNQVAAGEKHLAWNIISIGTDFDGYIDPVNPFPTVLEFEKFRNALINVITTELNSSSVSPSIRHFQSIEDIAEAVDAICYKNAENFVKKWYMV